MTAADKRLSRRQALACSAPPARARSPARAASRRPAVRRKVKLTYWNWADNPTHQKISLDASTCSTSRRASSRSRSTPTMAVMESRKKLVVAFAAGGAPDVIMTVQYWVQDYFDNGILQPIGDCFNKWDAKSDFFPNVVEQMRSKPGQPVLYTAADQHSVLPVLLRADWLKEDGSQPPETYDEFVAAAKAITRAPDRYRLSPCAG